MEILPTKLAVCLGISRLQSKGLRSKSLALIVLYVGHVHKLDKFTRQIKNLLIEYNRPFHAKLIMYAAKLICLIFCSYALLPLVGHNHHSCGAFLSRSLAHTQPSFYRSCIYVEGAVL